MTFETRSPRGRDEDKERLGKLVTHYLREGSPAWGEGEWERMLGKQGIWQERVLLLCRAADPPSAGDLVRLGGPETVGAASPSRETRPTCPEAAERTSGRWNREIPSIRQSPLWLPRRRSLE